MATSKLKPLMKSITLLSSLPLVPFLRPGKGPRLHRYPSSFRKQMEAPGGPGGAVRFRPGSEQPGNPAAINPLTLPRGQGTRGAEPTACMSGFSRKVGIPTYHPPSGAKASWMGDKRTNRWRVQRLHSSSRLSAQRAHSPNPCASTAPLPQHSSVVIICLPH